MLFLFYLTFQISLWFLIAMDSAILRCMTLLEVNILNELTNRSGGTGLFW